MDVYWLSVKHEHMDGHKKGSHGNTCEVLMNSTGHQSVLYFECFVSLVAIQDKVAIVA